MATHTCEICWQELKPEDTYKTNCVPVEHLFHINCIKFSYQKFKNKECPMCRKSLNINVNKLYPKCKHILVSGKNKGKNCSRKGQLEGYCEQHKKMHDISQNNPAETGVILINPKKVYKQQCESLTKKGKSCKNSSKFTTQHNGKTIHVCGIHKKYIPIIETINNNLNLLSLNDDPMIVS